MYHLKDDDLEALSKITVDNPLSLERPDPIRSTEVPDGFIMLSYDRYVSPSGEMFDWPEDFPLASHWDEY